ncbi:MAG: hypothetical protein EOO11_08155 [Chitinophagaceae bacterium]|nr:MAG: hypothetical protein EOO11_08155 [Chitinophagaceae bacterium]
MTKTISGLFLAGLSLFLSSCKRNDIEGSECAASKVLFFVSGATPAEEAHYTYTDGRVSEARFMYLRLRYSYDGQGRVVRREQYHGIDPDLKEFDIVTYDAGNRPGQVEHYIKTYAGTERVDSILFRYQGGQLIEQLYYHRMSWPAPMDLYFRQRFTYAGNNISQNIHDYYVDNQLVASDTARFSADNLPNHYATLHPQYFLYHPFGMFPSGFSWYFRTTTANNLLQTGTSPGSTREEYLTDERGRLAEYRVDGTPYLRFDYSCR